MLLHWNDTIFNDFLPFRQPDSVSVTVDARPVSVYFDDAKKIADLFAGRAMAPPYDKLNWDSKRMWDLDPEEVLAVFGPEEAAKKVARHSQGPGHDRRGQPES